MRGNALRHLKELAQDGTEKKYNSEKQLKISLNDKKFVDVVLCGSKKDLHGHRFVLAGKKETKDMKRVCLN